MCSGKTTLGRMLHSHLSSMGYNSSFVDTDKSVEQRYHLTVADCFRRYGETMFRSLETGVLHSLVEKSLDNDCNGISPIVVSTGGGTPCFYDNMQWMNDHGLTIYLRLPEAILVSRMIKSRKPRPLLTQLEITQYSSFVHEQLLTRTTFYSQAKKTVDGENLDIVRLLDTITTFLHQTRK